MRLKKKQKASGKKMQQITISAAPWDIGALGPANQNDLRTESATDIDPETGKETPNPNGVQRRRRDSWPEKYFRKGKINAHQLAAAIKLRDASEGMRERDPLAAIGDVFVRGDGDRQAACVDRRRYFNQLMAKIPYSSHPVIERVVISDVAVWKGNPDQVERYMQRLRIGLDAIC